VAVQGTTGAGSSTRWDVLAGFIGGFLVLEGRQD
jgi:hypothetical protein